ncbi:MAG TPA: aminotransferase class V-fold PLP-dependent enzyme [Solirubrobacteraceae bacterium]
MVAEVAAGADDALEQLRGLYGRAGTIAVVGCSSDRLRAANYVPRYMRAYGYQIVPVNPGQQTLLDERCFPRLTDVDRPVDVVQVFRRVEEAPAIAQDAVAIGASCLWLQLGLSSDEAARVGRAGGLQVVMDRCMGVVHGQLGLGPGLHLGDEWHRGLDVSVAPSADQQPFLQVTMGSANARAIPTDLELVIGSEGDGPGRIENDPELSRRHARIFRDRNDQVQIEDLDSANGIYVNGVRVQNQGLAVGDVVQLGATSLELRLPDARVAQGATNDASRLARASAVLTVGSMFSSDENALRLQFPVLERVAYLNAGSDGPVPRRALERASQRTAVVLEQGRSSDVNARQLRSIESALRSRYASTIGADADEIALTHGTADGISTVLWGLHLRRRDEILTSDEEHVSLLAPLAAVSKKFGVDVRVVPLAEIANAVGPRTRLVACSHVSWITGLEADVQGIVATGAPVLIDGAQAAGAIAVDVHEIGCDYYAASGQKWLCGPEGSGFLYVRRDRQRTLSPPWPSVLSLGEVSEMTELVFHAGARRFDTAAVVGPLATWALASLEVLAESGLRSNFERGPGLAQTLARRLNERGAAVAQRGNSTLVSWHAPDPEAVVSRLAAHQVVVRSIVHRGLVRASVGAWNTEDDVERVIEHAH